jgi:hypothetical protein
MVRRTLLVCISVAILATLPTAAQAVSVSDPDDPATRMDIRRASAVQVTDSKLRLKLVFWTRVPIPVLRHRVAGFEMSFEVPKHAHPAFGFRFWPTRHGRLRITYGEPASACCAQDWAHHPDPFTYVALIRFSMQDAVPPLKSVRAAGTRRFRSCWHRDCGLLITRRVDTTRWVSTAA